MTTTTADRPQPRPQDPRTHGGPSRHASGLTGPLIPVPPATHPGGDLVHPFAD